MLCINRALMRAILSTLGIGAGTTSDRQLRWIQAVLLKAMPHSERCMGSHVTEIQ